MLRALISNEGISDHEVFLLLVNFNTNTNLPLLELLQTMLYFRKSLCNGYAFLVSRTRIASISATRGKSFFGITVFLYQDKSLVDHKNHRRVRVYEGY
jgi:hypothetical protein